MKYYLNNEVVNYDTFAESLLDAITEEYGDGFEEFLDEVSPPIEIMGMTYDVSYVLQNIDPIAYDIMMSEYFDNVYQDKIYEMGRGQELILDGDIFMID